MRGSVLVVHGFGEHPERHSDLGKWFVQNGFQVSFCLLPDHGNGQKIDWKDWARVHASVRKGFESLVHTPRIVFGHSLGGLVVCGSVVEGVISPDYLILSAPLLLESTPPSMRLLYGVGGTLLPGATVTVNLDADGLTDSSEVYAEYVADPRVGKKCTLRTLRNMLRMLRTVDRLADTIRIPVFVLQGSKDTICRPVGSFRFSQRVPRATYLLLPGARHEFWDRRSAFRLPALRTLQCWINTL